jgi:hypothetical protein
MNTTNEPSNIEATREFTFEFYNTKQRRSNPVLEFYNNLWGLGTE